MILEALDNAVLTRAEAWSRAELIQTHHYDVAIDVTGAQDRAQETYPVSTTIRFSCHRPGEETFVDYLGADIDTIILNGRNLDVSEVAGRARIVLPDLQTDNEVHIRSRSRYSRSGEGLHRFVDPGTNETYLYTQYEPADSRRVFPVFEQPDLKAEFSFRITGPADWVLASNQPVMLREVKGKNATVHFSPTPVMSSYITTLLAGPYHQWTDQWRGHADSGAEPIELTLYARNSLQDSVDAPAIFEATKAGLTFFHDYFGISYPWGKYDQAFVPEYNLGAMENPGLVTFTEQYVFSSQATEAQYLGRATTIMHEMAHMWFGNLVTMKWWDDLWLKESFADYMGTLAVDQATDFDSAWTVFANRRKGWAYVQDQYPTTHPIVADIRDLEAARQNFDGITYAKGASVLKQLVAFVGDEAFREASIEYFRQHAWGNATLEEFMAVLERASGRDMSLWVQRWLQTAGVPELTIEGSQLVHSGCDPRTGENTLRPHVLRVGRYELDEQNVLVRVADATVELTQSESATEIFPLNLAADSVRLLLPNDEDLTYAKIKLDQQSLDAVLQYPVADPLASATVWAALWNMTRDAALPAREFVHAVCRLADTISDGGVHSAVLAQTVTAIEYFLPPEQRDETYSQLSQTLRTSMVELESGSDHQRTATRIWANVVRLSGKDLDHVEQLIGDNEYQKELVPGLHFDDEVRWLMLISLASHGRISIRELDEHLKSSLNASTRLWHRTARYAYPTSDTRAAAWHQVLTGEDEAGETLSNDMLSATAQAVYSNRPELVAHLWVSLREQLFTIWTGRSNELATRTINGLFPGHCDIDNSRSQQHGDHPLIRDLSQWLDDHLDAPAALRRILIERQDDVLRRLKAQARGRDVSIPND